MTDPRIPVDDIQDVATWRCIKELQDQIQRNQNQIGQLDKGLQVLLKELNQIKKGVIQWKKSH